ncbi:hypothetical protein DFW101_3561 [Solidesulfovibrio carbinoliphilus subsp. oakridgensis]|uniref:Uncharacterized protein n=1 Tax=Solidesulfovibrio carbinoliphilus subsp. oakridgensis TaxID=694327 RepID=G7Q5J8_9BACT|nr:hypothetical protein [Solidesulfovibrio carbinoliphilus]EHJ49557.1 hypothetical protein DFW101_3561 [Solidesulfovibrio carbinoliphilus subsp. oakridgensis]
MGCGKATKGPWSVAKFDGNTVVQAEPVLAHGFPGKVSWNIAIVMGTPGGRDKQANARMMAAAPDLLAALEAVEWQGSMFKDLEGKPYTTCPACRRAKVEGHAPGCLIGNALAKARGEV